MKPSGKPITRAPLLAGLADQPAGLRGRALAVEEHRCGLHRRDLHRAVAVTHCSLLSHAAFVAQHDGGCKARSRAAAMSGQPARRRGTLTTATIASTAAAASARNDGARLAVVHQRAEDQRRHDAGDVEAGGDEAEHLAVGAGRRHLAHDHVARRHQRAGAEAGQRHHRDQQHARRDRRWPISSAGAARCRAGRARRSARGGWCARRSRPPTSTPIAPSARWPVSAVLAVDRRVPYSAPSATTEKFMQAEAGHRQQHEEHEVDQDRRRQQQLPARCRRAARRRAAWRPAATGAARRAATAARRRRRSRASPRRGSAAPAEQAVHQQQRAPGAAALPSMPAKVWIE